MKKTKVIVILVSLLIICLIATIVALKFPYNKSNNELNSPIENINDELPINKVDVPDEGSNVDKNLNGIADPIDIVNSARKEADQSRRLYIKMHTILADIHQKALGFALM